MPKMSKLPKMPKIEVSLRSVPFYVFRMIGCLNFRHSSPAIASRSGESGGLVHFRQFRHFYALPRNIT
jgi:hypothetical protein